jgi:PAS domain S-box-containing protein
MDTREILNGLGIDALTILDAMGEGVYILDESGMFVFVNRIVEKNSGLSLGQFRALHYLDFVPPEHREKAKNGFERAIRGDIAGPVEFQYDTADGNKGTFILRGRLISAPGKPGALLVIVKNISDRKNAEDAFRQSEHRYHVLVDNLIIGLFVCELATGRFVYLNERTCEMFGYSMEEGLTFSIWDVVPPEDHDIIKKRVLRKMQGEMPLSAAHVYTVTHKNGTRFRAEVSAYPVTWEGNTAIQGTVRDVSETESLQNQLLQAQKMKAIGTLAGGIAHDFNNLLMGIQGNISLMMLDMGADNPHLLMAKQVQEMVRSGSALTMQLLGLARGGKYETRPENINDILVKSADMFGRTRREISITLQLHPEPWTVQVNRSQIEQVLLNLFVNAWQAMPGGGRLTLGTENVVIGNANMQRELPEGKYVKITVTDTGTGMDEETSRRIFDPFFTTKSMGRGVGLGLTSAYGIIKNHDGIIDFRTEKARGTSFFIYLPGSDMEVPDRSAGSVELPGGGETILVVDDEKTVLTITGRLLEKLGYRVMTAASGEEALTAFTARRDEVDLIILDMIMPEISGGDLFGKLKEIKSSIKVLLASGYSIDGEAEKILGMGCDGFIQKPFSINELANKVRSILEGQGG